MLRRCATCYGNQPQVAHWNLARLAEALLPLVSDQAPLEQGLALYAETFNKAWRGALAQKLGVAALDQPGDDELLSDLFALMYEKETDFTLFFRNLATVPLDDADEAALLKPLEPAFYAEAAPGLDGWLRRYASRVADQPERVERMNKANPKYVFRNYLAQLAIDALEKGDASVMERLLKVLGAAVRRATGAPRARRPAAGVGAQPGGMLSAVLQLLS